MALEFEVPLQFSDLEINKDREGFAVQNKTELLEGDDARVAEVSEAALEALSAAPESVTENRVFDPIYSLIAAFAHLSERRRVELARALCRALKAVLLSARRLAKTRAAAGDLGSDPDGDVAEQTQTLRNAFKMLSFLATSLLGAAERADKNAAMLAGKKPRAAGAGAGAGAGGKGKKARKGKKDGDADGDDGDSKFSWQSEKESVCETLLAVLDCAEAYQLWSRASPEEAFGNLFFKAACALMESAENLRNKSLRPLIFRLFAVSVKKHGLKIPATAALIHLLHNFEHVSTAMVELLRCMAEENDHAEFVAEVIREVGRINSAMVADSAAARSVAEFLAALGAQLPRFAMRHLSVLVAHLDGENYSIRNGVVQLLGNLLQSAELKDNAANAQRRDALLSVLEERALDVSSYTRSKVLQTWIELVAAEAVPVAMLPSIVILASQRLLDKASQVRKYAMQLLTALLQHNPFSSKLSLTVFKAELERVGLEFKEDVASLQSRLHEAASKRKQDAELARRGFWGSTSGGKKTAAAAEGSGAKSAKAKSRGKKGGKRKARRDSEDSESEAEELEVSEDEEVEAIAEVDEEAAEGEEKAPDAPATDEGAGAVETPTEQEGPAEATATAAPVISESEDLELKAKRKQLDFFFDAICFVTGFHNSQGALLMLLGSKTNTDVLEAIQFFTTAAEFQLETAAEGVRKMLILVWSREAPIVEALIAAYQKLYVGELDAMESGANKQRQAMITAGRLVSLTLDATLADLTSLEELLTRLIAKKLVPPSVFAMLWEILLGRVAGTSPSEWNGALVVLTMAANALPEVIVSHLPALLQVGFGPRAKEHTSFTRNVCAALQKVVAARQKETREATSRIAEKMLGKAEVDDICEKLLALLQTPAVSFDANGRAVHDEAWYPAAEQAVGALFCLHAQPETVCGELLKSLARGVTGLVEDAGSASAKASTLARFFFVLGHVSIKLLLRLERVEDSLKRARAASAKAPQQDAAAAGEKSGGEGKAGKAASKIEDELAVGASQDLEIEQMREAAERSLLAQNLLGSLAPLVVKVCSNPKRFRDRVLQASAVLALCKLMCLSEDFCNEHLAVLVSIPRASDDPHVRANIVIALGDMCLRFPNLMDTRTHFLFERLGDKSPMVRKHTMLVLTHLILNDMLKIRGPVSDIAKCLQDEDQVIAGLAHAFFTELSQKSKDPIYNILPDIISRLSSDPGVSSEAFRYVLKFLLEFIDKERQVEGLIEKLCHRIAGSASDKECRDFSYCLAQLNLTEKSFRKLADLFRLYKDSLVDEAVHANFLAMSAKAKKLPKAELKTVIDEFEAKLEECHKRQRDDNASVQRAKAVKKVAAGPGDENVPPLEQTQTSTEFDVEAKVAEAFQRAAAARQEAELQKKATRGRKPADEPVADDGKSVAKGKKGKRAAPAKKPAKPRKRKVESSSEDEDDQEIDELSVSEPDD